MAVSATGTFKEIIEDLKGGFEDLEKSIRSDVYGSWMLHVINSASQRPPCPAHHIIARDGQIGWYHYLPSDRAQMRLDQRYKSFEPVMGEIIMSAIDRAWDNMF